MLPIMAFTTIFYIIKLFNYIKNFQKIIEEIYLDNSGNEIIVIYRNRKYRAMRGTKQEEVIITSALINPDPYKYPILKGIYSI